MQLKCFNMGACWVFDKSIMLDELDYLKKIYKELEFNDRIFAMLYYADEANLWNDVGIYMANPLRIPDNYDEIKANRDAALAKPSERVGYLTKHLNYFMPSNSGEEFIDIEKVRLCRADKPFDWYGKKVYIGLDLAFSDDNVSVSMVCDEDEIIHAKSWAFIPSGRIDVKNKKERTDYNRFIEAGVCFSCGDEIVSYTYIENFVMSLEEEYGVDIVQIGYDRYNAPSTVGKLNNAGYITVEVKQHSSILHSPTKLLYESILEKKFSYEKNLLYEINFQNAKCTYDTNKNRYINKKASSGKIDMVASTIDAIYLLEQERLANIGNFVIQVI